MAHGAKFVNDWGTVQIDQDYLNVSIVESGVAASGVYSAMTERNLMPLIFYKVPASANSLNAGVFSMVTGSGLPPKNRLGYTGAGGNPSLAPAGMEYRVGNVGPANGGPLNGWGMKVWGPSGELSYNSLQPQMQIVAAQTIHADTAGPGTYGTIALPDSSQDYWIAFPQDCAAADSWVDSSGQWFDCHAAGAYWQSANVIALAMSTVYQYRIDYYTNVRHQDCFQPSLTYVVAKIV